MNDLMDEDSFSSFIPHDITCYYPTGNLSGSKGQHGAPMLGLENTLGQISQSIFSQRCVRRLAGICLMTNADSRRSESLRSGIHVSHRGNQQANQSSFTAASVVHQVSQ